MRKIVKVLSHQDRVSGRILSGGSVVSRNREGEILVQEIENGFFEKRRCNNFSSSPYLYLPHDLFNSFRVTCPN